MNMEHGMEPIKPILKQIFYWWGGGLIDPPTWIGLSSFRSLKLFKLVFYEFPESVSLP